MVAKAAGGMLAKVTSNILLESRLSTLSVATCECWVGGTRINPAWGISKKDMQFLNKIRAS